MSINEEENEKVRQVYITTFDNPFDPFDNSDDWLMFDIEKGYCTNNKVARLVNLTDDMTEKEELEEIERAIDRLIEIDPLDIYKKVVKET